MIAVTACVAKAVTREYSIQILLQKQSSDSLVHQYKASTSTNNVLGSSGAYSHKIDQKLSLHKHILQMPTSVSKLHKNLLAIYPQSPTLHPVF